MAKDQTGKRAVRPLAVAAAALAVAITVIEAGPAQAAAWCARYQTGASNCGFASQSQCLAAISGIGGSCVPDESTASTVAAEKPAAKGAAASKRKQAVKRVSPSAPPAAAVTPAASATAMAAPAALAAAPARPLPVQFTAARQLVFDGQYEAGVGALQALHLDDHPEVAAYLGLAHRGLGRIVEARAWYDKALHADPNHLLALLFDGMLRAEQGDLRVARDNLERVARACGNRTCSEYRALDEVIVRSSR
jgi:tetratricopeptide (TPR) repeat protein